MKELLLKSEHETQELAERIGEQLESGDCLVLTGELGAGKTTFTKGLAKGMDIEQMVKSPTYTIIREYRQGRLPMFHMDVYRLEDSGDDLGLDDYYDSEGVTVIEWGRNISENLPESYLEIVLSYEEQENRRLISFHPVGDQGEELASRALKNIGNINNQQREGR